MSLGLSSSLVILLLLFGLAMSAWVYRANPGHPENRGFPLMVMAILAWVVFYHLAQLDNPTFWFRLSGASVFLFFVSYYFFIVEWFLRKQGKAFRTLGRLVLTYCVSLAALTVATDIIIPESRQVDSVARPVFSDVGWWLFYGFVTATTVFINWLLIREYVGYPEQLRLKIQYFLIGMLLFAGFNIVFNVALPVGFGVYEYYELGNYSVVFLLGFTAYAIVKQELFGIRTVLATLFVGAIALLLAIDMLGFTERSDLQAFKGAVLVLFLYFGYLLVQSVQRDVAQREELQAIAAELRRSDEAKTEFISIVSHQLRSPLNAMKGYLSLFLEGTYGDLDAQMRAAMERVYQSNERLIRLVEDLLNVSRIQLGKIELEMEDVDLCKVTQSVVDEFSLAAEEKGIELFARCPERGVPPVKGDTQKLRDTILNLVNNAISYTDEGCVDVAVRRMSDDVVVSVKDTGPGLDEAEARALFESFKRGEVGKKRSTEGTGLGLYIAQQFVMLHGGTIWAESEGKGRGTTFFIRLPLPDGQSAAPGGLREWPGA